MTLNQHSLTHYNLEQKILQMTVLKKLHSNKTLNLSASQMLQLEQYQKLIRTVKKQIKDSKAVESEMVSFAECVCNIFDGILQQCYWEYRMARTDFQAYFLRIKVQDTTINSKRGSKTLDEVMGLQSRQPAELLLNCDDHLLFPLKGSIKDFDVGTLKSKAIQILSKLPYVKDKNSQKLIVPIVNEILPYHNFTHSFSVFLSFYTLSILPDFSENFDEFELFFALLACLSHDINHNANNTLFQVKAKSQLALNYGNTAVMEKMHLAKTMDILERGKQTNELFNALNNEQKIRARRIVSKAILATDMSKHYNYVEAISKKKLDNKAAEDRELLIQVLTHACDIQNPSLDFHNYIFWANLVCIQFNDQTIKQKACGMEITEFLKFDSLPYFYKNQLTFTNTVVTPLWESLQSLYPQIAIKEFTKKINKNSVALTENLRRNSEPLQKPIAKYLQFRLGK